MYLINVHLSLGGEAAIPECDSVVILVSIKIKPHSFDQSLDMSKQA